MNGNKLEELREERNLKSKDLSEVLKVHKSTYSQWENDKIPIPTKRMIQIANYYQTSIDYIFGLSKTKKKIKTLENIDLIKIGSRLKEIRCDMNLSIRALGNKLNTAFSSLASYERGEVLIQSDILISLCKISNCSADWVLGNSEEKYLK